MRALVFEALILALLISAYLLYQYYKKWKMKQRIARCVNSCPDDILHSLYSWRYQVDIPSAYRVRPGEETSFAVAIVNEFQQTLMSQYFQGSHPIPLIQSRTLRDFNRSYTDTDYCMYAFLRFLGNYDLGYQFCGHDVLGDCISTEHFKGGGYWRTYSLTDFGVTYFKLLYAATKICKSISAFVVSDTCESASDCIDSRQIQISFRQ